MWARLKEKLTGVSKVSVQRGKFGIVSWRVSSTDDARHLPQRLRAERSRYHLGRARRARDVGRPEAGAQEARRALALTPANPWALAVLGQCLQRQATPDIAGARRATEQAWALDPTNGYFVRLLLDVLDEQADGQARSELLDWAWWKGAPVERWLPDGVTPLHAQDRPSGRTTGEATAATQSTATSQVNVPAAVPA